MCETRYPLEMESAFTASDPSLEQVLPVFVRGLQVCANETYFDCPYYEEMMYPADTRLEVLVTYIMSRDDRLPRKALTLFDASRLPSGLTQSRYPCRVMQIIASWTLWWVAMVRDYALWRDDRPFVESLMPGVRATMEGFPALLRPGRPAACPRGLEQLRLGACLGRGSRLPARRCFGRKWCAQLAPDIYPHPIRRPGSPPG